MIFQEGHPILRREVEANAKELGEDLALDDKNFARKILAAAARAAAKQSSTRLVTLAEMEHGLK